MSVARKILAASVKSRAAYDEIAARLEPAELGDIYGPLWSEIAAYYDRDAEAANADAALITEKMASGQRGEKRQRAVRDMCGEVWAEDVSVRNVVNYVRELGLQSAATRMGAAVAGQRDQSEIEALARRYVELCDAPAISEAEEQHTFASAVRARLSGADRIPVMPLSLNERLGGGVFTGTHITLFGRPEVGKSALALTMACGWARRGFRGLYLQNEDPLTTMMVRAACNLTNKTQEELGADPDAAERLAFEKGAGNIIFRDLAPGTPAEIERLVKEIRPQWLVVDQLRNLHIRGAGSRTEQLDVAAQFVRTVAKRYGLVGVSVTQAGDSASGKLVLDMGDVDYSNTGVPGACDVLVGVGMNDEYARNGQRMLSLSKNKVTSRHEFWPVAIDPFRSKYRSLQS